MSEHAFKLAFEDPEGIQRTSEYGYHNAVAAQEAAPTLNYVRCLLDCPRYTHVLELLGETPVGIRELGSAA